MHSPTDEHLMEIIRQNRINRALLQILPTLDIPHSMLVAGALFQTFWNHRAGPPPLSGASRTMTSLTLMLICRGRRKTG